MPRKRTKYLARKAFIKGKQKLRQFPTRVGGKADFSIPATSPLKVQIETQTQKTHSTTIGRGPQNWATK